MGIYGLGGIASALLAAAALGCDGRRVWRRAGCLGLAALVLGLLAVLPSRNRGDAAHTTIHMAGVQMEFPSEPDVLRALERTARLHPEAELIVLSEYTFDGPPPVKVRERMFRNGAGTNTR